MNKQIENSRGRPKGSPNRATADVRAAIAAFAEGNAHKLQDWLDRVADGSGGVKPDPAKAADLYLRAIEYHIPKLARTEVTGDGGGPVEITGITIKLKKPDES
jgi:hypothetical protein